MAGHVNSEGERLMIMEATRPPFEGRDLLVIYDDPPPRGSGVRAPMLLDEGTAGFLLEELSVRFGERWRYADMLGLVRFMVAQLDGREWEASTLEPIAERLEAVLGRPLADPPFDPAPDGHLEADFEDRVSGTEEL